jgi:hypothetical protein
MAGSEVIDSEDGKRMDEFQDWAWWRDDDADRLFRLFLTACMLGSD